MPELDPPTSSDDASLVLPGEDAVATPPGTAEPADDTALVLPDADAAVGPTTVAVPDVSEPAVPVTPQPAADVVAQRPATPLDAITQALYAHGDAVAMASVLTSALATLFPRDLVDVRYDRTMADRMARRPGTPVSVTVRAGDRVLTLSSHDSRPVASVTHEVRGVRLSTTEVPVAEWISMLAEEVARQAERDAAARAAVERFLLQ